MEALLMLDRSTTNLFDSDTAVSSPGESQGQETVASEARGNGSQQPPPGSPRSRLGRQRRISPRRPAKWRPRLAITPSKIRLPRRYLSAPVALLVFLLHVLLSGGGNAVPHRTLASSPQPVTPTTVSVSRAPVAIGHLGQARHHAQRTVGTRRSVAAPRSVVSVSTPQSSPAAAQSVQGTVEAPPSTPTSVPSYSAAPSETAQTAARVSPSESATAETELEFGFER
jgi:hypothetical protein